ncbi:MAG: hypothetical protein R3E97_02290 [Candidatus Eisenbacteria bacterium]
MALQIGSSPSLPAKRNHPRCAPSSRRVSFWFAAMAFGVAALTLIPVSNAWAEDGAAVLSRVLRASGLDHLSEKKRIAFTFHVEAGENKVQRAWEWNLETDTVRQDGAEVGKTPKFINDVYWLLFPAMVGWDRDKVEFTAEPSVDGPLTQQTVTKLTAKYVDGGGATPNDMYELYVAGNGDVVEWAYHKAGAVEPTRQTAWTGYEVIGGLRLSLDRPGDGFRVWFTDVVVE